MTANPTPHRPFGCVVEVEQPARNDPKAEVFAANLVTTLLALVPLWIATTRTWTSEQLQHAASEATDMIASHGDALQFGGKERGQSLNALAKGLAILAHAEGGVTEMGIHACLEAHDACPGDRREPRPAHRTPTTTTDSGPATTPVVALRIEPAELKHKIGTTFWDADRWQWPHPFPATADWHRAWPVLLNDAIEHAEGLLVDPATGHPVALIAPDRDRAADGPPLTVEIRDPDTGRVLATHTYTGPLPERPDRTDPGTWECAAADATHALLTVLADLNRAATPPTQ